MSKEKWMLISLGIMNFILVIMHLTRYVLLFLKPTGYILPLVINIVMIIIILIKSKLSKVWTIVVITSILFISIPVMLFYSFILLLQDYSYTEIDNPYRNQSVIIEYRHATLGETTYFYNFYKTKFGFIGKRLNDQSITIMVRDYLSSNDAEGVFGLGNEEWLSANTVRFFTREGPKDIHLNPLQSLFKLENTEESINNFMDKGRNVE